MPEQPRHRTVVVVAGGDTPPHVGLRAVLPTPDLVVAADSGVHHARLLGMHVDVVVGDLDSATPDDLAHATAEGAAIERFPVAKDQTDLELALDRAAVLGGAGATLVVVASIGGRLDHALANLLVLAAPAYAAHRVEAFVDRWHVSLVRDEERELTTRPGATVTLLVLDEPSLRVRTEGLAYPLHDEPLLRFSTRGVSNVADGDRCRVAARGGALFVLREWAD